MHTLRSPTIYALYMHDDFVRYDRFLLECYLFQKSDLNVKNTKTYHDYNHGALGIKILENFPLNAAAGYPDKIAQVFSFQAFTALQDLLIREGNIIHTITADGIPAFFHVYPTYPDCGEPFPTYQSIAEHLPDDLHYFRKFRNANYLLVTETFKQRWKAAKLKGATFLLKWDGKRVYPRV